MNKRRVTAALAAVLLSLSFSTMAYAGGADSEDTTQPPGPVEAPAVTEPPAEKPFNPAGTGTVVDNATDEDGKEFYTIMTPSENVFYLVIDKQRTAENVYFLNAVTEKDLLALAEQTTKEEAPAAPVSPEPPAEETPAPEEPPAKQGGNMSLLIVVLVLAGVGGGAAYYFKVLRPKQQGQPEEDLDEAEYMEADTAEEDDGPPWYEDDTDTEEGSR